MFITEAVVASLVDSTVVDHSVRETKVVLMVDERDFTVVIDDGCVLEIVD